MTGTKLTYIPEVIVDTENLTEAEWLNYRRRGIGGSEAAAILGLSPFCTARDIYYDKKGIKPAEDENSGNWVAKQVGHRLEDLIAEIFSAKTGLKVYKDKRMFSHPLYPFMIADLDYIVEMPDGTTAILECKTTNYNCQDKWIGGSVPVNYEIQCRHYMSVRNVDTVFIACLYGNNENEFEYSRIDRDLDYEENIIAEEAHFWNEFIQKSIEPPYTESGDLVLESIRRHYGSADTKAASVEFDADTVQIIEKYLDLRNQKLDLDHQSQDIEDKMKQVYAPLVEKLGTNCTGVCKSNTVEYTISYKPSYRTSVNKDDLKKLKTLHPDIYDEYASTSESRRFSITRKEKEAI